MDIGDFDIERMQHIKESYIKTIDPLLNAETFIKESNFIYQITTHALKQPHFSVDDKELKDLYKNALLYFRGDNRSEWDLEKGIFIFGGTGSGKSIFFEIFKEYTRHLGHNSFIKSKQIKIVADVAKNGINVLDSYVKDPKPIVLYIDDFGSGNSVINHFGTSYDVMDELMQARYDEFVRSGVITHITTNIKPSEFKEKYSDRITSRLSAMFNVIQFPTKDYRRVKF
jgi:DNA replication protein DnaC